jgi:hypothetical protein
MKLRDGIIIYATKEAKKQYKDKIIKKEKKSYCPSCELDLRNKSISNTTISEDILKENN